MSSWSSIALAATLSLALPSGFVRANHSAQEVEEVERLDPAVAASLERTLDEVTPTSSEALYTEAILAHGKVEPLITELERLAKDEEASAERRASAKHLWARQLERRGDLEEALVVAEELCADAGVGDGVPQVAHLLLKARLLDALGRLEDSVKAWEELLPLADEEQLQTSIHLRLALLKMERDDEHKDALAAYAGAEGRDEELRNRAAVVLGLIDRPEDAIELFRIDEAHEKRFRQEVRVAEWAITAEDAESAQKHGWNAVFSAKLKRDRHYGLAILIEAHRLDDSLDPLIDKFAKEPELDDIVRRAWIGLLRERERYDEAIELFRGTGDNTFDIEMRRELLEMYREAGDEAVMLDVYRDLIEREPFEVEWREGLSRAHLERGDRAAGEQTWRTLLDDPESFPERLRAASALMELGLDDLAIEAAESCIAARKNPYAALIFLFQLHRDRGRLDLAEAALARMAEMAPPDAAERFQLADSWEQLDRQELAIEVLEGLRESRGPEGGGEDLEMRLAWLYSEIGEEEVALERWLELWRKINSISRRRYAEDRMMTVASRLGSLADIAIDLEQKLLDGRANDRESGLLVRLYTKVGDPVSAAEVIDEFLEQSGGSVVDSLQEKARVYLACNDYFNYEEVVRELIVADPDGEGDYLRQLAMSQLERGKPDEARKVLTHLKEIEMGTESLEFEAGVLALAGLREEAIEAYRRGIAENPGRIESYLLMANLMKELGRTQRAVGMFQHLAENAEQDDLFTIAIDGLLNLEAPAPVLEWARRITLERLARRHDKMYLYQLLSDLAEQVDDTDGMLLALENSLSISGERRPSVLRELMDIAGGAGGSPFGRAPEGNSDKHLAYGRRLIGLAEVVPPQVYLDLGEAFLKNDEARSAEKTFALASDLPDYPNFQRQAAGLFEAAGFREEALALFKRVLVARSSDVGLMVKVGELEEQEGRDEVASGLYGRALDLLFSRQPLSSLDAKGEPISDSPFMWYGARNIDDFDKHYNRLLKNVLVVRSSPEEVESMMSTQLEALRGDLASLEAERSERAEEDVKNERERSTLGHHPRIRSRASFYRRLAIAYERPDLADALDLELLQAFPEDDGLLEQLCQGRVKWGLYGSVRNLIENAERPEKDRNKLRFLVGEGLDERSARRLPVEQSEGLFLPLLITDKPKEAATLILRTDFAQASPEDLSSIEPLFSASLFLGDPGLTLQVAREWVRLHVKAKSGSYMVEPVLQKCRNALDDEGYRNLCLSFTDQVLEKPEETSGFLIMLPKLQKEFDEPLITEDQVMDLLDDYADGGWGFGLGPVITLLPVDNRGAAMRTIWAKVKPTTQARFLLDMVGQAEEELGSPVAEFIEGVFAESLGEADRVYSYYVQRLVDAKHNHALSLVMLEAMIEHTPDDWAAKSGRAMKLLVLEREDEALEQGLEVFTALIDDDLSDYNNRRARDNVFEKFLPEQLDRFLAELDRVVEERGNSPELVQKRLEVLEKVEDKAAIRELLMAAAEEFPDDEDLIVRRRRQASQEGRRLDSVKLLEKLVELDEEKLPQLFGAWSGMHHPVNALAVKEQLMEKAEEEDEPTPGSNIPGVPAGLVLPAGVTVVTSAGTFTTGGGSGKKAMEDRPTIEGIKKSVDQEDWEKARTTLRRLWRKFPSGEAKSRSSITYFFGGNSSQQVLAWPEDEAEETEEEEEEKEVHRGGLDSWSDEEPEEPEPQKNAYEVLAQYEFGVDEMHRLLRSKSASELDGIREVFMGLLEARLLESGPEATLNDLVEVVASGRGSKVDTTMLLTMLDEHPDLQSEDADAVLGDLLQSVRPTDIGPIRSLARVHARQGKLAEARRLYRWCATRTEGSGFSYFGEAATVSANELVKEVKEQLEGEDRLEVIDSIIEFADPGDYLWARQNFENLILETYMELLDPAQALERCQEIVDEATDFKEGLRRRTAMNASVLLASSGKIEEALHCLEYGICSLDESVVEGEASYWSSPTRPGYWGTAQYKQLFPKDSSKFADPIAWYDAASRAVETWIAEDRVRRDQAVRALVILTLRLSAAGEVGRAGEIVAALAELEELSPTLELWIADAARELGDEELAHRIERKQFDEGRLHLERVHELLARELETAGPAVTLELGAKAAEYTQHEKFLEVMVAAAEANGEAEPLERWTALQETASAARARLEEIAEEEKRKREEKKAAESEG